MVATYNFSLINDKNTILNKFNLLLYIRINKVIPLYNALLVDHAYKQVYNAKIHLHDQILSKYITVSSLTST